jgi:hypothetical protein
VVLTPELVAPFGFGMFEYSQIPEPAHHYDKAVEAQAIRDAQGVWRQVWELVPMSEAERLKADHDQAVIMRHGEYLTVYANLENIEVKMGDKVSVKQPLGTVVTDREENRTVLHFELWKGAEKQNPANWIAKQK